MTLKRTEYLVDSANKNRSVVILLLDDANAVVVLQDFAAFPEIVEDGLIFQKVDLSAQNGQVAHHVFQILYL